MKIVNTTNGQAYQLKPGTQLEIERTNPFFNEWGEQSLPIELPDTDLNRKLLGYPDMLSNCNKVSSKIESIIQDGDYFMPCRQAILEARRHEKISTTFYMNEGSFFAKIADVSLKDVFGEETIPRVSTVEGGINFCRSLVDGNNPNFAIFPVLIDDGSTTSSGTPDYKQINRFGQTINGSFFDMIMSGNPDFYNAIDRTEKVDGDIIKVTAGFYMSPFIKANYLLKRIFQYFGYTLIDNFFTETTPFKNMVFINTCADALVNGTIRLVNLVPDCMCNTILEVFRKRFFCEFIPNEVTRTVTIELFKDIIDRKESYDLSPYLTSQPIISYPDTYQQLMLLSKDTLSDSNSINFEGSLSDLATKYPTIEYNQKYGYFYRVGFVYNGYLLIGGPWFSKIENKISESSTRYYAGGNLPKEEISVPDLQPEFRSFGTGNTTFLFIGSPQFLNSKIIKGETTTPDTTDINDSPSNKELKPILAFAYTMANYPRGTITNHSNVEGFIQIPDTRLWDYTLCFNGPEGIFEKFYRPYDNLLRNSLHPVKVSLLLPSNLKSTIPSHLPVSLNNQKMLINSFNYQIGGMNEPIDSELLTMKLYEPKDTAPLFSEIITSQDYEWTAHAEATNITSSEYESSPYKDLTFDPIYPSERPSADLASSGSKYYERTTCLNYPAVLGGLGYVRCDYWLTCEKRQSKLSVL